MPVETPGEVEFEQRHLHRTGACSGTSDDLMDWYGRWPEQFFDEVDCIVVAVHELRLGSIWDHGRPDPTNRPKFLHHVMRILNQGRSVADQLIAALGTRVER